jgi:hypothetical protein
MAPLSPDAIGALIGGIATGGAASAVVIAKWLVPVLKGMKSDVGQVKSELGVDTPGAKIHETLGEIRQAQKDSDRRLSSEQKELRDSLVKHEERHLELDATIKGHGEAISELSGKHDALATRVANIGPPKGTSERRKTGKGGGK